MNNKQWLRIWVFIVMIVMSITSGINFYIDPLGLFNYKHNLNLLQYVSDERYQKSFWLKYKVNIDEINTLLIGASRTTYFNQNKFGDLKVFNYAVSSGSTQEYSSLIKYAETCKNNHFDNIILSLDFIGTRKIEEKIIQNRILKKNDIIYKDVLLKYFSIGTLKYSFINVMRSLSNKTYHRSYTRDGIVVTDKVSKELVIKKVRTYTHYINTLKSISKNYNSSYVNVLKGIKNHTDTNYIVYTSPIAQPFLNEIYNDDNLRNSYFKWIRDMVTVFDKVYFFTMPSDFSKNYAEYSFDGSHYYPNITEIISEIIIDKKDIKGFGLVLRKDNIDVQIEELKRTIKNNNTFN